MVGGHYASPDLGKAFHAYAAAGAEDDHEGTRMEDAVARARQGMKPMLRYGSAWHDVAAQAGAITVRYRLRLLTMIANRWLSFRKNTLSMGDRVLVVGDGEAGQIATWLLGRKMFRGAFSIVGIINDSDPTKYGMRVNGNWMLGSLKDLPRVIKNYDVGVILSAGMSASRETNEYIFDLCQANHIRLFFLNDLMLMVDRQVTQPRGSFEYPVWLDERLEYKAMHHATTGLPNRYLFQDRLKHSLAYAKRYKTLLAVLLVKVDGLRMVNEEIGRKYGDQILLETGQLRGQRAGRPAGLFTFVPRVEGELPAAVEIQPLRPLEVRARMLGKGDAVAPRRLCRERTADQDEAPRQARQQFDARREAERGQARHPSRQRPDGRRGADQHHRLGKIPLQHGRELVGQTGPLIDGIPAGLSQ